MPGPLLPNRSIFPDWVKPENASVFDPGWRGPIRTLINALGLDDPQQVMALGMPIETGPSGGGMLEKLAETFPRVAKAIKAYHGSPHDFEKFSTEQIGTGEGAQVYGHGLYFAEKEGTARSYRDALSFAQHSGTREQGQLFFDELAKGGTIGGKVPFGRNQTLMTPEQMQEAFVSGRVSAFDFPPMVQKRVEAQIVGKGKMYEVNIHADPEHMLDWDKPLSEQPPNVLRALRTLGIEPIPPAQAQSIASETGGHGYNYVAARVGGRAGAAQALQEQGVPGIRYLDQGSRTAGEGTRNFVVFDDKTIEILKKYGILLPAAGLGTRVSQQQ